MYTKSLNTCRKDLGTSFCQNQQNNVKRRGGPFGYREGQANQIYPPTRRRGAGKLKSPPQASQGGGDLLLLLLWNAEYLLKTRASKSRIIMRPGLPFPENAPGPGTWACWSLAESYDPLGKSDHCQFAILQAFNFAGRFQSWLPPHIKSPSGRLCISHVLIAKYKTC